MVRLEGSKGIEHPITIREVRYIAKAGCNRIVWLRFIPALERNKRHSLRDWYRLIREAIPLYCAWQRRKMGGYWEIYEGDALNDLAWAIHRFVFSFLAMACHVGVSDAGMLQFTLQAVPENLHNEVRRLYLMHQEQGAAPWIEEVARQIDARITEQTGDPWSEIVIKMLNELNKARWYRMRDPRRLKKIATSWHLPPYYTFCNETIQTILGRQGVSKGTPFHQWVERREAILTAILDQVAGAILGQGDCSYRLDESSSGGAT